MAVSVIPCGMGGPGGHRYSVQLRALPKIPFPVAALMRVVQAPSKCHG